MLTVRLDFVTRARRTGIKALLMLSCTTVAFPAVARGDDGADKASAASNSSMGRSSDGAGNDAGEDEAKRYDDASQARALDEALLPSFDMLSPTGGPSFAGLKLDGSISRSQYRGRAGLVGVLASGAIIATQFRSANSMTVSAPALTSPSANQPALGNTNDPIVNPEPGTVALLASGLAAIAYAGSRRRSGTRRA